MSNISELDVDYVIEFMLEATPIKDTFPKIYCEAKMFFSKLGLKDKKIDCCADGQMLYYDNKFGKMTRHYGNSSDIVRHPSDGEA